MEKKVERETQLLAIEIVSTNDKCCVNVILRSDQKIPISLLVQSLETFTQQLKDKFPAKSKIEVPAPKLILP